MINFVSNLSSFGVCPQTTQYLNYSKNYSSMADCGEQTPVPGAKAEEEGGGASEGQPVVKSAKQLKKDAKKKEKMEKFQQKQAKMAGQQSNSGSEVREERMY